MSTEGANVKRQQCQTEKELTRAVKECEELHITIDSMKDRLVPVLREEPPMETGEKDEEPLVPLASDIRNIRRQVSTANERLKRILDRMEL